LNQLAQGGIKPEPQVEAASAAEHHQSGAAAGAPVIVAIRCLGAEGGQTR
jgi:hypothetical protein